MVLSPPFGSTAARCEKDQQGCCEAAATRRGFKGQPPFKRGAFKPGGERHDAVAMRGWSGMCVAVSSPGLPQAGRVVFEAVRDCRGIARW